MQAAIELARQDIAGYLGMAGMENKLVLVLRDTKTDTAEALRLMQVFYSDGIRMVIGPYSSAELSHIRKFADASGMLVVSPSSVAVSLAIPGDNIFRMVTSDVIQGKAMSKLLTEDKIRVVIPFIRDDVWGNDLASATGQDFTGSGGVMLEPVRYAPSTVDFSAALTLLDTAVAAELAHHNGNDIAVYMLSFAEGTTILREAKKYGHLNNVYWYGGSAFAQNAGAVSDTTAALFAYTHGLPCPLFGLDESARNNWEPLKERIETIIGRAPEVYAFSAYDAVWVMMKAFRTAGANASAETLKTVFMAEAAGYFGATGNTLLDDNGDRAVGNYDFWTVKKVTEFYEWKRVAGTTHLPEQSPGRLISFLGISASDQRSRFTKNTFPSPSL
jgi:branched-chain amino acid transport system substrate-binding protein